MNEQIFKLEDKVFDIRYGWGTVINGIDIDDIDNLYPIRVDFNKYIITYTYDGKITDEDKHPILSFTEYTLQGFSQERPYRDYVGKWGKFWNDNEKLFVVGQLCWYNENNDGKPYEFKGKDYAFFKPFTEEQVKVLEL